jgi:hypothetical protein
MVINLFCCLAGRARRFMALLWRAQDTANTRDVLTLDAWGTTRCHRPSRGASSVVHAGNAIGDWSVVAAAVTDLVRPEEPGSATRLLACLADLSRCRGELFLAEHLAWDALSRASIAASASRALALRVLGEVLIAQQRGSEGIHVLELAVMTADLGDAPQELAAALCDCGTYYIDEADYFAAEQRFRRAVALSEQCGIGGELLGVAHHGLAVARLNRRQEYYALSNASMERVGRCDLRMIVRSENALLELSETCEVRFN